MATNLQMYYQSLGRGLAFPVRVDSGRGGFVVAQEETLVKQSIQQILNTDPSERPYLLKNGVPYGTRLRKYLFSASDVLLAASQADIKQALDTWEPRIVVQSAEVRRQASSNGGSILVVNIAFTYRSTNRSDNLVYPIELVPAV